MVKRVVICKLSLFILTGFFQALKLSCIIIGGFSFMDVLVFVKQSKCHIEYSSDLKKKPLLVTLKAVVCRLFLIRKMA
jgi:hypothetical protein